jgi:hypothetical protein
VAAAVDRTQGGVEVLLELRELAVDVDIALTAQSVGLDVCGVDEPGGLGVGRLHDLGLGHQTLLFFDAFLDGMLPFSTRRSASDFARLVAASYSRLADAAIRDASSRASPTIRSLC